MKTRRVPVTIVGTHHSDEQLLVTVLVSGWPGGKPVHIAADLLPWPWRHRPQEAEGKTFFAWANIGKEDEKELFVSCFEPEPAETERFLGH